MFFVAFSVFPYAPGFSIGLGSGFGFYGNAAAKDRSDYDFKNAFNMYAEANILFPLGSKFFLSGGVDDFFSFAWDGSDSYNIADINFNFGARFYPGLYGFLVGIDYSIGHRTDFIDLPGMNKKTETSKWGNGFKISAEYDFMHEKKGFSPVLGMAWRFVPRGDEIFDNFLIFYGKLMKK